MNDFALVLPPSSSLIWVGTVGWKRKRANSHNNLFKISQVLREKSSFLLQILELSSRRIFLLLFFVAPRFVFWPPWCNDKKGGSNRMYSVYKYIVQIANSRHILNGFWPMCLVGWISLQTLSVCAWITAFIYYTYSA